MLNTLLMTIITFRPVCLPPVAIRSPVKSHSECHAVRISKLIVLLYVLEVHKIDVTFNLFRHIFKQNFELFHRTDVAHTRVKCACLCCSVLRPSLLSHCLSFSLGVSVLPLMPLCRDLTDCSLGAFPRAFGAVDSLAQLLSM